jgi:hypothetical protein
MHPYSDRTLPLTAGTESWNTFLQMMTVHDIMTANGDGAKQVWGTEYRGCHRHSDRSTSEAQQAAISAGYARLRTGLAVGSGRCSPTRSGTSSNNLWDWQVELRVKRFDGSPKPAYDAFHRSDGRPLVR